MTNAPVFRTVGISVCLVTLLSRPVTATPLAGTPWETAAIQNNVDPILLYAVTLTESRRRRGNEYTPWPWAFNSPEGPYYASSRREAEEYLTHLVTTYPLHSIDVGAGQINLGWNGRLVDDYHDLLDLNTNLTIAAYILKKAIASTNNLLLGVGRYHSWTDEEKIQWYGSLVLERYRRIKRFFNDQG